MNLKDILKLYKNETISQAKDGTTTKVYLISNKYILKLYDKQYNIKDEQKILLLLQNQKVAKIIEKYYYDDTLCVIYEQIGGLSITKPTCVHIRQIGIFLKNMHKATKNQIINKPKKYSKNYLFDMIKISKNKELLKYYNELDIKLKDDGIIHGDLFCDNAKFLFNKLSGVYDFSCSCVGDFLFDLSVIAISWCFDKHTLNKQKLLVLLLSYDKSITICKLRPYIKYSLLYYTTLRVIQNRDYKIMLKRLQKL